MHTFYLPQQEWPAENASPHYLHGAEALHLSKVLRLKPGDEVELLDGCGRLGNFEIVELDKKRVTLRLKSLQNVQRPTRRCTLALGYNKGLRRSWLLEKAVEFEADALWFWQAERSQGKMPLIEQEQETAETWRAQLIAGAKQCRNPWLPEIKTLPGGAPELAACCAEFSAAYVLWEAATADDLIRIQHLHSSNTLFVLGPEGGISDTEMQIMQKAGFVPLSLGNRVLRWETAALLCLGLSWWSRQ